MKKSISYYIVALVLRLKGIKKVFSESPINYQKLRKEDVKEPKCVFYKKHSTRFKVCDTVVTEILAVKASKKLILFFPGGAFVSGPAKHHWVTIRKLYKEINYTIWVCDYPKAPEHKITQISANIDAVYARALTTYTPDAIVVMGDSVGATLSISLVQRLLKNGENVPSKVILITPVLDASMTNSTIDEIDDLDIMLAKKGVLSAKKMCATNNALKTPDISPIYGSFNGFPKTTLCLATHDIMYADAKLLEEKLAKNNIDHTIVLGEGMPHIWPLLPFLKEGKLALNEIIKELKI